MVSNNILTIFCSLHKGMHIKATVVAYAFLVQYFENVTIVAYSNVAANSQHSNPDVTVNLK